MIIDGILNHCTILNSKDLKRIINKFAVFAVYEKNAQFDLSFTKCFEPLSHSFASYNTTLFSNKNKLKVDTKNYIFYMVLENMISVLQVLRYFVKLA